MKRTMESIDEVKTEKVGTEENKKRKYVSVIDVANCFLYLQQQTSLKPEARIDSIKIQKLVYYAQGYYMGMYKERLFAEPLIKYIYGPFCQELHKINILDLLLLKQKYLM
jgi:hypothetical protein